MSSRHQAGRNKHPIHFSFIQCEVWFSWLIPKCEIASFNSTTLLVLCLWVNEESFIIRVLVTRTLKGFWRSATYGLKIKVLSVNPFERIGLEYQCLKGEGRNTSVWTPRFVRIRYEFQFLKVQGWNFNVYKKRTRISKFERMGQEYQICLNG